MCSHASEEAPEKIHKAWDCCPRETVRFVCRLICRKTVFVCTGTYRKTEGWLNGRSVFELVKQGTISNLYLGIVNGHQSWCIGPNTEVKDAFLRVHDAAKLPSGVASTWTETRPSSQVDRNRKAKKGTGVLCVCMCVCVWFRVAHSA
jgi:hypothetical protein